MFTIGGKSQREIYANLYTSRRMTPLKIGQLEGLFPLAQK
jgi:hypothetical protein